MKVSLVASCVFVFPTLFTPVVRAELVNSAPRISARRAALPSGTIVKAVLAKPVDSRKLKVGEAVYATAIEDVKADGRVVVIKGSQLVGHVTEVSPKGEGQACASVGMRFDHAVVRGREVEMHSLVQAIAAAQAEMAPAEQVDAALLSRANNELTALAGDSAAKPRKAPVGALYAASTGVAGLRGISLETKAAARSDSSVVSSTGASVHLSDGTRMVLRVGE